MKRFLAREWLWLIGCVVVVAVGYASYYATWTAPALPDVAAMVRRHFPQTYDGMPDATLRAGVLARYPDYPLLKTRPAGAPEEELPMPVDGPLASGPLALTLVHLQGSPKEHLFPRQASPAEITAVMNGLYPEPGADKLSRFGANMLTGAVWGLALYAILGFRLLIRWLLTVGTPDGPPAQPAELEEPDEVDGSEPQEGGRV